MDWKKRSGFTLIELLVVIAIIAIMASIGLVSFANVQTKARDAKRRADMEDTQKSFEQFYAANGGYAAAGCTAGMYAGLPTGAKPAPVKSGDAAYSCSADATAYCSCAILENLTAGNATTDCSASTPFQPTWGAGGKYYCVRNLQ